MTTPRFSLALLCLPALALLPFAGGCSGSACDALAECCATLSPLAAPSCQAAVSQQNGALCEQTLAAFEAGGSCQPSPSGPRSTFAGTDPGPVASAADTSSCVVLAGCCATLPAQVAASCAQSAGTGMTSVCDPVLASLQSGGFCAAGGPAPASSTTDPDPFTGSPAGPAPADPWADPDGDDQPDPYPGTDPATDPFPAASCDSCLQESVAADGACAPAWDSCLAQPDCQALNDCLSSCGADPACPQSCAAAHPAGLTPFLAVFDCARSVCSDLCGDASSDGGSSSGSGSGSSSGGYDDNQRAVCRAAGGGSAC